MEDYLSFSGPAKLLIIERALIEAKSKSWKEGNRKILTRLIINEQGTPSSELKDSSTLEYEYNENKQLMRVVEKEKNGTLTEETVISYKNNLPVKKLRTSSDGSIREIRDFTYNDKNLLVQERCGSRLIRYEYNCNNQLAKEYRYYGKEPELALLYSCDSTGNICEIKTVDSNGKKIRTEKFKWENKLMTAFSCINGNNVILSDDVYEYSCFHDGNWLKRVKYSLMDNSTREPVDIIYRSITYSDNYPEIEPVCESSPEILKEEKTSLSFRDGSIYRGSILNGKMDGQGYIQWSDGSSYKGDFRENRMNGKGILSWPNGDIYSGSFNDGKMEGVGRIRWKNGKTFYGLFENNRRTNQGIIEEN